MHVSFSGKRVRKPTVLLRVGRRALSKRALSLGLFLAVCQILDGILTYIGLGMAGIEMEGNRLLGSMMYFYGVAPAIFMVKCAALILVGALTFYAHNRPWVRTLIAVAIAIYLVFAVIPWTYIISEGHARAILPRF